MDNDRRLMTVRWREYGASDTSESGAEMALRESRCARIRHDELFLGVNHNHKVVIVRTAASGRTFEVAGATIE
jgi:hypothetical protein